ncbi:DNA ligase 1-like [Clytia hemisphaerica]|uniref:DNA ligase 1-like n=1 Tax=Clytia hemisphaerica TaxID=252671 RepID=UPI0034D6FD1E
MMLSQNTIQELVVFEKEWLKTKTEEKEVDERRKEVDERVATNEKAEVQEIKRKKQNSSQGSTTKHGLIYDFPSFCVGNYHKETSIKPTKKVTKKKKAENETEEKPEDKKKRKKKLDKVREKESKRDKNIEVQKPQTDIISTEKMANVNSFVFKKVNLGLPAAKPKSSGFSVVCTEKRPDFLKNASSATSKPADKTTSDDCDLIVRPVDRDSSTLTIAENQDTITIDTDDLDVTMITDDINTNDAIQLDKVTNPDSVDDSSTATGLLRDDHPTDETVDKDATADNDIIFETPGNYERTGNTD